MYKDKNKIKELKQSNALYPSYDDCQSPATAPFS